MNLFTQTVLLRTRGFPFLGGRLPHGETSHFGRFCLEIERISL